MVVEAHCPRLGVNVYIVVAELFKAGLQLPSIPLFEVVGSGFSVEPIQTGLGVLKVGVTKEFTTTSIDLVSVQPLLSVIATV